MLTSDVYFVFKGLCFVSYATATERLTWMGAALPICVINKVLTVAAA